MIRKLWWSACAVATLAVAPSVCPAADKPVLSVAVSGVQELLDDIDYLGNLSGNPGQGAQLEAMSTFFTQGYGLEGIDKKRPLGASVTASEAGEFQVLVFVPVAKMDKLRGLISIAGQPEDAGDGVWEVASDRQSMFFKEQGAWCFFAQKKEALADLPEDPVATLDGLNTRYDLAAEVHVQSLPEPLREMFIDQLQVGMQASMQQEEGESDEQYELRKGMAEQQIAAMSQAINEVDQITVGWNIDRAAKQVYLDFAMSALAGSKAAEKFNEYKTNTSPSKFAGFLNPEAIFTMHTHSVLGEEDRANAEQSVAAMREQAKAALANDDSLGDDERQLAERLIEDMMELAAVQLKDGNFNVGAVVTGDGPISIVTGGAVADGALVEEKLKKWVTLASQADGFPKVKYDAAEFEGVKFHTAAVEIPKDADDREKAVALFGEKVEITVGLGKDSAFLAIGPGGIDAVKKVITDSKKPTEKSKTPLEMSLAVGKLLAVTAKADEDMGEELGGLAEALKAAGDDHFRVETTMIENGAQYRFLLEEGVIKAMAELQKIQQQRQLQGDEDGDDDEGDDEDGDDEEEDSEEE